MQIRILNPAKLPSSETLRQCSKGLDKRIKTATNAERERLRIIQSEINFLIENL